MLALKRRNEEIARHRLRTNERTNERTDGRTNDEMFENDQKSQNKHSENWIRKSWKIMCAVAKCKNKKFSLFSTFAVAFSCSLENFILNFVNFKFFQTFFSDFFFQTFFHPTFSKSSNVRFFFVAGCLKVPKGCLSGARFARNFFEKHFWKPTQND